MPPFQGIFPAQGSHPGSLPHYRQILYCLNYTQPYSEPQIFLLTLVELCQRGIVSSSAQISSDIQPLAVGAWGRSVY